MKESLLLGAAFLATVGGVAIFRLVGRSARLMDVPNERSSHAEPKLRGGGIVIVLVCLVGYITASYLTGTPARWSYVAGAFIVASVSWLDDVYNLPAAVRFAAHGAAAATLIWSLGTVDSVFLPVAGYTFELGWLGTVGTFVWIVWLVNAYNFMDGIDGIAGGQAIVAGLAWGAFGYLTAEPLLHLFGLTVAFSSLGFLFHNWSPAAVFMGDVGSAFLGFTFAAMPLLITGNGSSHGGWLFPAAVCFVWLFVFDAAFTFARRVVKGETVWKAHRQHLYQRLVISGKPHRTVSLFYSAIASIVAAAFLLAFDFRGIAEILLLFLLVLSAVVVAAIALRKKV